MAHNLEIVKGKAAMMYVGEPPWHGLGIQLERPATAEKAINAAGMNWKVRKVPLVAAIEGARIPAVGRFAIVREDSSGTPCAPVLGVVGKGYEPLQNHEAFEFFDHIVGKGAAIYHTAGVLGEGERIWILAKLPGEIRVVGEDITNKYLLLSTSHDGSGAVQVKFTPVRVVCQNTLIQALSRGRTIKVAHTRNIKERLHLAEETLGIVTKGYESTAENYKAMSGYNLGAQELKTFLEGVFPMPSNWKEKGTDQKTLKKVLQRRERAMDCFENGRGQRLKGVPGTLWAAYNAVTESVDHLWQHTNDDRRLKSQWFGEGYQVKARAYEIALQLLLDPAA
jgi:phage/plasmid-like protein (TIGR03299 family)